MVAASGARGFFGSLAAKNRLPLAIFGVGLKIAGSSQRPRDMKNPDFVRTEFL